MFTVDVKQQYNQQPTRKSYFITRAGVGVGVSKMLKVYIKVFLIIWYDERYWSKILFSTIPTPSHDLQIRVTDLEI